MFSVFLHKFLNVTSLDAINQQITDLLRYLSSCWTKTLAMIGFDFVLIRNISWNTLAYICKCFLNLWVQLNLIVLTRNFTINNLIGILWVFSKALCLHQLSCQTLIWLWGRISKLWLNLDILLLSDIWLSNWLLDWNLRLV